MKQVEIVANGKGKNVSNKYSNCDGLNFCVNVGVNNGIHASFRSNCSKCSG